MPRRHHPGKTQASLVARIEERVLASSGADAFELVFALVAARLWQARSAAPLPASRSGAGSVRAASRAWPFLGLAPLPEVSAALLAEIDGLLEGLAVGSRPGGARSHAERTDGLDALFEQLVTRVGKGEKGQFFTPGPVAGFLAHALHLGDGERVLDPACGSGALLAHARQCAKVETFGADIDARAVRVAQLLALATFEDPARITRGDSLESAHDLPLDLDVVLTNPPFAGRAPAEGYELASVGGPVERDALFLERCLTLLRAGGRLGIVLPHNKVAGASFKGLRAWLLSRARVFAVVSLPHATFMPHTSQKTVVLLAKKRARAGGGLGGAAEGEERVFFASADRGDSGHLEGDLARIGAELGPFLASEGFSA